MRSRDRHADDRLSAFLDDELTERDSLEVTRHLAACDRCLGELDDIRSARSALRGLPNLDPPATMFSDVVTAAVVEADRWRRYVRVSSAAIVGLTLIGAAAFFAGAEQDGDVRPPVDMFVVDHVVRTGGGPVITAVDLGR